MPEHLTRDEFMAHVGPIREGIAEIMRLQREQNSRVSKAEVKIAVLEDRSPGRISAGVSAVVSGVVSGLGVWFGSK